MGKGENEMYAREEYMKKIDNNRIKIIDLIKYCIKKWRLLVLLFSVFSLFFIGVIFINYKKEPIVIEPIGMDDLSESSRKKVEDTLKMYEELKNIDIYRREATCMGLNAYDCNITVLQYMILPEASLEGLKLYDLYANFVKEGRLKVTLEEELGGQMKYPSDLVTLIDQAIPKSFLVPDQYVLSIKINANDLEESKRITEVVKHEIENYCHELATEVEEHSLKFVSEDSYSGMDTALKEQQDRITKDYDSKRLQITNLENTLSVEEKTVLLAEKDEIIEQASPVLKSSFSWIFVIIAFIASGIASCMVIAVYYVYCNKIKLENEIITLYDIPLLGEICEEMSAEETKRLGNELLLYCSGLENKTIFFSQLDGNGDCKDKLENINHFLDSYGIKMEIGENLCKSLEDIKKAVVCKNLIFIYQLDKTTYSNLDSFFQKCSNYGLNVVGAICKK